MRLGETVLKKRQARGLSQEKLAELVGVSRQAVSKWEVGDAIPDTDKLIPLARALGISVDELLGNVPEEEEVQEDSAEPPLSGSYDASWVEDEFASAPEQKPGWFATHWYWIGIVPVVWGAWQLMKLILVLVGALIFAGNVGYAEVVPGPMEIPAPEEIILEEEIVQREGFGFEHITELG